MTCAAVRGRSNTVTGVVAAGNDGSMTVVIGTESFIWTDDRGVNVECTSEIVVRWRAL